MCRRRRAAFPVDEAWRLEEEILRIQAEHGNVSGLCLGEWLPHGMGQAGFSTSLPTVIPHHLPGAGDRAACTRLSCGGRPGPEAAVPGTAAASRCSPYTVRTERAGGHLVMRVQSLDDVPDQLPGVKGDGVEGLGADPRPKERNASVCSFSGSARAVTLPPWAFSAGWPGGIDAGEGLAPRRR